MAFIGDIAPLTTTGTGPVPTALAQVQPTGGTTASNTPAPSSSTSSGSTSKPNAYAWLLAWGVLLTFLTLVNRSRIGHAVIYYALLLMLFFVILSNYRFVQTALNPFSTLPAQ